jgi:hypothetical protein
MWLLTPLVSRRAHRVSTSSQARTMRRRIGLPTFLLLYLYGGPALSQSLGDAPKSQLIVGLAYLDYQSPNPYGSPGAIGVDASLERVIAARLAVRVTAAAARTQFSDGHVSICYLQSDMRTCWPPGVYPNSLTTLEAHALVRPIREIPLRIVGGIGIARAQNPRSQRSLATVPGLGPHTSGMWRAGVELKLGSSHRAPRVTFSQSGFSSEPYSISVLNTLALSFSPWQSNGGGGR